MGKLGGGGLLVIGIVVIIIGWLIRSNLLEWLLDIIGFVIIAGGIITAVVGLIQMFSNKGD